MKKAQAAMEFMMTYGWAILIVLAAIAALAYFGVFRSGDNIVPVCKLESGFSCDQKVTPNSITLVINNGASKDITVDTITVGGCSDLTVDTAFNRDDKITFVLTGCDNGDAGTKFKGDVTIEYTEVESGIDRTMKGTVMTRIEAS